MVDPTVWHRADRAATTTQWVIRWTSNTDNKTPPPRQNGRDGTGRRVERASPESIQVRRRGVGGYARERRRLRLARRWLRDGVQPIARCVGRSAKTKSRISRLWDSVASWAAARSGFPCGAGLDLGGEGGGVEGRLGPNAAAVLSVA